MPNKAKDHAAMRKSVCAVCFLKPKTLRPISKLASSLICKFVFSEFCDSPWSWLPSHICGICYLEIMRTRDNPSHTLKHVDYVTLSPPAAVVTRSVTSWQCSVCSVGRLNGLSYVLHKSKVLQKTIDLNNNIPPPKTPQNYPLQSQ